MVNYAWKKNTGMVTSMHCKMPIINRKKLGSKWGLVEYKEMHL